MAHTQTRGKAAGILAICLAAVLVVVFAIPFLGMANGTDGQTSMKNPSPTASATPDSTSEPEACATTWMTVESDNTNNRWYYEGIAAIRDASTNEEAVAAAHEWQMETRKDPDLLAGAAKVFFQRDVDRSTLVDSEGCATQAAVDLDLEVGIAIASSKITPDDVPDSAHNTGVENGTVVGADHAGIGGDRSAIQIVLPDGRTIWIMARCGNLATEGPPPLPPGKTDTPDCPEGEKYNENGVCVAPKSDDPADYRQPGDGGKGQDVGTGTKPVVPQVSTPAETTPPPVQTVAPGGNGVVDTPTNTPGSETGVQAPGTTPAPATPSAPPPPNEGGSNDGEVGGF